MRQKNLLSLLFSTAIKEMRESTTLSIKEVAKETGVGETYMRHIEGGHEYLKTSIVFNYCKALEFRLNPAKTLMISSLVQWILGADKKIDLINELLISYRDNLFVHKYLTLTKEKIRIKYFETKDISTIRDELESEWIKEMILYISEPTSDLAQSHLDDDQIKNVIRDEIVNMSKEHSKIVIDLIKHLNGLKSKGLKTYLV